MNKVIKTEKLPNGGEKLIFNDGTTVEHDAKWMAYVEKARKRYQITAGRKTCRVTLQTGRG